MKNIFNLTLFITFFVITSEVNLFALDKIKEENEDLIQSVIKLVQEEYIDETVEDEIVESAINGMLQSLDPHSVYLNQKNFKELTNDTKGEFGGLGIEVTMEKGLVKVISPIDGTPAEKAGIIEGDLITHINKDPILGKSLSDAVSLMRGKPNTEIQITIARQGLQEGFDLKLVREIIKVPGVLVNIKGDNSDIGYIRVSSFNEKTSDELYKEIIKFEFDPNNQIKSYILDLRRNPGGLLSQAIQVTNFFLDEGNIVSTKRPRFDKTINEYKAKKGDLIFGKPLLVIVNGGSASASEIVAGALQDNKRAIILGTKTFGKGSVQTLFPIEKNNLFLPNDLYGAVKLTTAEYFTPSGRSIQAKGIEPDIMINQNFKDENYDSLTVGETKLNKYIKNENNNIESGSSAYIPADEINDTQLNEAIKILSNLNKKI
ncbi:MAG: S41 family peptidase [Rhizobiales bacterium TMED168]|nr:MAG: S41 family peptidase [Rhizobiales bacterium TMED168]|tara:strand:+ start:5952 stop:7244 length:1293 start_codon:yes stop_codon:yes gene_type:complete